MISDFANSLVTDPPFQVWILIPLFAFLESCAGVGLLVSGVLLLSTSTLLYAADSITLSALIPLAFIGAFAGDQTGYWLGHQIGPSIWKSQYLRKHEDRTKKIESLFLKSAPWAVCIGRLSPPIRSITPIVAGVSGLPPFKFIAYDLLACTIWVTGLYILVTQLSKL